ncbi:TolC family protein [Peribacillus saganii]|nr:TolC family protein [Peribacillus saganii]
MRKVTTLLCAATIAGLPLAVTAQAAEETNNTEIIENVQPGEGTPAEEVKNEDVKVLTLEDVIKRGIENDQNLTVMQYELEALKNQTLDVADDKRDALNDVRDLEKKLKRLKDQRDRITDTTKRIINGQERIGINDGLEALDDQITSLENAIKSLESGQVQLKLQEEEVKEGLSLKLTSTYVNLLTLQKQMDFTKKAVQSSINDVQKAEKLYKYGAGSKEAIDQAKREQVNTEKQLEQQQKNYYHDLATLAFDIDVIYNPELQVTPIEMNVTAAAKVENYNSLIEGSFQMKRAKDNLELAKYNRDQAYADEDATQFEKQENDFKVKAAEETIKQLQKELTTKIETLNHNADVSKLNYEESLRKLEDVKLDLVNLEKRYRLGVVSKYNYEQAKLQLEQSTLGAELAKSQYFMVEQSINALNKGFVQ